MTNGETLLSNIVKSAEGTLKTGFETISITYSVDPTTDLLAFSGTIPIQTAVGADGTIKYTAKDFITFLVES